MSRERGLRHLARVEEGARMVETIARTAGAAALSVMLMCASDATEGHNEAQ